LRPEAHDARGKLPAFWRRQVQSAIDGLGEDPRPPRSKALDGTGIDVPRGIEIRRIRIDPWRIVYAVNDERGWVWVLALRRRPPYGYEDLHDLADRLA
jgi:mRNA-degrading endonuclease RelE of RelBE toxin-antitoxin system